MNKKMSDKEELIILEQKIKQAEAYGQPIDKYILREIEILQQTIDTFVEQMEKEGRLNDAQVGAVEIRQYSAMKQLSQKINLPVDKYDKLIKEVQCRIMGQDNWETFFGK